MRGHLALTSARLASHEISTIFVVDLPFNPPTSAFLDAEHSPQFGPFPEVDLGPDDVPGLLDFRFTAGLRVLVASADEQRARALMRRIKTFSPAEIVAAGFDKILRWTPKE